MVDTRKLRGVIAENGKTQKDVAEMIGITPKTFYERMQRGVFGSDEIQIMTLTVWRIPWMRTCWSLPM